MNKKIITLLKIVGIVLIVFFLGMSIRNNYNDIIQYDFTIQWGYLAFAGLLWIISIVWSIFVWGKLILKGLGANLATKDVYRIGIISFLLMYVPGKMLFSGYRVGMGKLKGVSAMKSISALTYEGAFNLITAILFSINILYPFTIPISFIVLFILPYWKGVLSKVNGLIGKVPMPKMFGVDKLEMPNLANIRLVYVAMYLIQFLEGFAIFFLIRSIYPIPFSQIIIVAAMFELAWSIGYLSFLTPAGVGVRETFLVLFFSTIMPPHIATIVAILQRLFVIVNESILGLILVPSIQIAKMVGWTSD